MNTFLSSLKRSNKNYTYERIVCSDILGVVHITNDMDGDGKDTNVKKGGATDKLRSGYRKQERRYREISTDFYMNDDDADD
jgi:hypothetical protein